jgi:hypothetical protein
LNPEQLLTERIEALAEKGEQQQMNPEIPSGLETDPEVSAKRTAEMQQMAIAKQIAEPNPPSQRSLTIIWDDEKQAILERLGAVEAFGPTLYSARLDIGERLDAQAQVIEALAQRVLTLENHILNLQGANVQISRN